jgi:hypothetical protein
MASLLVLIAGMVAGALVRRWSFVAGVTLIAVTISLIGWLTGLTVSQDSSAAMGAILWAAAVWIPLALGASLGVYIGLGHQRGRQRKSAAGRS